MNDMLERNMSTNMETLKPNTLERLISRKLQVSEVLKYAFLCSYILIPILSVEGLVSWSIGIIGFYKTINIYISQSQNTAKKAVCLFAVLLIITIAYNLIINYFGRVYS